MKFKIIVLTAIFTLMSLGLVAETPEEIFEKNIKATGGSDKFEKINTWQMTANVSVQAQGMELQVKCKMKKPEKILLITEIPSMQMTMEAGYDGTTYWATQPGSKTRTAVPEMMQEQIKAQLGSFKNMFEPIASKYKEKGLKAEYKGITDADGKKCHKIALVDKDGNKSDIYFDSITYLLYKTQAETEAGGTKAVVDSKITEYQKVEGITMPKSIEVYQDGQMVTSMKFTEVKLNQPIDDKEFGVQ